MNSKFDVGDSSPVGFEGVDEGLPGRISQERESASEGLDDDGGRVEPFEDG